MWTRPLFNKSDLVYSSSDSAPSRPNPSPGSREHHLAGCSLLPQLAASNKSTVSPSQGNSCGMEERDGKLSGRDSECLLGEEAEFVYSAIGPVPSPPNTLKANP